MIYNIHLNCSKNYDNELINLVFILNFIRTSHTHLDLFNLLGIPGIV